MVALSPSAQKIQNLLNDLGHPIHVLEFANTTRTAAEAAAAIGCEVGAIAKSIVFMSKDRHLPVLVVASGAVRVNERQVAAALATPLGGERLIKADADFVRQNTGFAIGGVPPLGHLTKPLAVFDRGLLAYPLVYAAAGTANSVFPIAPALLAELVGARVLDLDA